MQTRILPPVAASKEGRKREEIEVDGGREVRSFRSMARPYLVYHVNFTNGIHMLFCHQLLILPPIFRFTPKMLMLKAQSECVKISCLQPVRQCHTSKEVVGCTTYQCQSAPTPTQQQQQHQHVDVDGRWPPKEVILPPPPTERPRPNVGTIQALSMVAHLNNHLHLIGLVFSALDL